MNQTTRIGLATPIGLVLSLAAALVACRGGDDDDDTTTPDAGGADDTSIYDIQDGTVGDGAIVTLRGVVVVAIDNYGNSRGSLWVAEPDEHATYGRAYSGVQVFTSDLSVVAGLAVGDLVDVVDAEVDEFTFADCADPDVDCDDTLQTLTEVKLPASIDKVGTAAVPAPVVVRPQDLAADPNEAEKWEGVLIRFDDVAVTQGPRDIGSDTTLKGIRVTGPFQVQSALTDLGDVQRDDCFASIVGVGNWVFDYMLYPRSAEDLVRAADMSACVYETQAADCDDGLDNDYDGFTDCQDFSCQDANPQLCTVGATVVAVQDGTVSENTRVQLSGVVVTAVSADGVDLWVQDAGSTSDYNGLHVFRGAGAPAIAVAVGDVVDVAGVVTEFFDETELAVDPTVADVSVTGTGTVSVRSDVPVATLADAVAGEPYEGMLVEIADVRVVTMNDGFGNFTVGIAGEDLNVDDKLHGSFTLPAEGTCFSTIRGVMGFAFGERKLYPRDAADLVTGTTCP